MKKPKSTTLAGMLGVFLGVFGVHDWYLGKKKPALIHSILAVISIAFMIVVVACSSADETLAHLLRSGSGIMFIFYSFAWIVWLLNTLWGTVEGFMILDRGDARLNLEPAFKKRFQIVCSSLAGVISVASVVLVVFAVLLRVDYAETYRVARQLRAGVSELYNGGACDKVVDYADSAWISESTYNNYVNTCKQLLSDNITFINELGTTSGVNKDSQILAQFRLFEDSYTSTMPSTDELTPKLDLYKAWHDYVYVADDLTTSSSETEYQAAADILIDTGNADFIEYAKGWIELAIAYRTAYHAYWDNTNAGSTEYDTMTAARLNLRTYDNESTPDLAKVTNLTFPNTSKMYQEFRSLYSLITDAYEKHYDYDSGDCTTIGEKVYCS